MPRRYQRKRTVGADIPADAVYVGRPTKWGNPFPLNKPISADDELAATFLFPLLPAIGTGGTTLDRVPFRTVNVLDPEVVVAAYFDYLVNNPPLWLSIKPELGGKDLVCWCPLDAPCHADILLELANG